MSSDKIRENKYRRMLLRRGMSLMKSRRRDPKATDYGGYMIAELSTNALIVGGSPVPYSLTLDQVKTWLHDN